MRTVQVRIGQIREGKVRKGCQVRFGEVTQGWVSGEGLEGKVKKTERERYGTDEKKKGWKGEEKDNK